MASKFRGLIFADSPPSLRRLILLLYAAVGVPFVALQYFVGGHAGRRWDLVAVAVLFSIISGLLAWVIHGKSGRGIGELVPPDVAARSGDAIDRRQAEVEHRLLATLIAEMQDSVIVTDDQLRVRFWSGASARMYGWTAEEVLGRSVPELLRTAPEEGTEEELLARLLSGTPQSFRGTDVRKDGSRVATLVDVAPLKDGSGRPAGFLAVARDMTRELAAGRALRESDLRWRSVVSAAGEGIVMRQADGVVSVFNEAAERLLGITAEQMQGLAPAPAGWDVIREDGTSVPAEERPNNVALRTGVPVAGFVMGIRKPGEVVTWVSVNSQPVFREGERTPHAVVAAYRDVTQERLQAAEVRRSREQLALAIDGSSLGVWDWDLGTDRTTYGPQWPALLGYGTDEIERTTRAWAALVHPEDAARVKQAFGAHLRGSTSSLEAEYRMRARDGAWRWIHTRGRVVARDDRGRARRVVGTHADVTLRREAEEKLREALSANELLVRDLRDSQERLRLSLSAASQVQWDYDVAREVLSAGLGSELFQGGGSPVFATGAQAWRAKVHPEDQARAWKDVERCLVGKVDHYESEYRLQDARGEWRWVRSRGRVTERDAGGRPLRLLGTVTDVTEVHRLQERLVAATRLASVGTLAAGVAHEINNPLASVAGNVSYLLDRLPAGDEVTPTAAERAELRELLGEMKQGTDRIAAIVKAMRTLGRPERADRLYDIDVRAEVLGALQLVRIQLLRRARLEVDVPEGLPRARGKTSELGRVFVNLLTNAAQAIPEGQAPQNRISVRARADGGEVVVEIGDTGAGMSPSVRERIFEPFFTTRQVGQGTGLGLSIVKSILDAAGGRVEVESQEGRGTVFRVALPVAADA